MVYIMGVKWLDLKDFHQVLCSDENGPKNPSETRVLPQIGTPLVIHATCTTLPDRKSTSWENGSSGGIRSSGDDSSSLANLSDRVHHPNKIDC